MTKIAPMPVMTLGLDLVTSASQVDGVGAFQIYLGANLWSNSCWLAILARKGIAIERWVKALDR